MKTLRLQKNLLRKLIISATAGITLVIASLVPVSSSAQVHNFQKHFGSAQYRDMANKIHALPDQGYIITGAAHTDDPIRKSDLFLTRTNADGTTMWSYTYGCIDDTEPIAKDWGNSVIPTSDNGFVVVGGVELHNGSKFYYIIKVDQNGTLLWESLRGTDAELFDVIEDNGDYVAVGWNEIPGTANRDILLTKYSVSGALLNSRRVRANSNDLDDEARSITKTTDGYAVTGFRRVERFGYNAQEVLLLEIDQNFSTIFQFKSYYDNNQSMEDIWDMWGNNIISTRDGGLLIVGAKHLRDNKHGNLNTRGIVMKFGDNRELSWVKKMPNLSYGLSEVFQAKELLQYNPLTGSILGSDGFIVGGYCNGTSGFAGPMQLSSAYGFLMHLDENNGSFLGSRSYRPSNNTSVSLFRSIALIDRGLYTSFADKGVAAVGGTSNVENNQPWNAWFIKTNGFSLETPCYTYTGPTVEDTDVSKNNATPLKQPANLPVMIKKLHKQGYSPVETICYEYSKRAALSSPVGNDIARILPNPVRPGETLRLEINLASQQGEIVITITDIMGKTVFSGVEQMSTGSNIVSLDIPRLAPGSYFINIENQQQVHRLNLMIAE